jgi:hypothetical protein
VQIIKEMSEFHFLPPKINFVPSFTQFNKKISKLPHLTIFLPHFTPFYILVHPGPCSRAEPNHSKWWFILAG